ncbi:MAG: HAD-IA family hydrolase, partial [Clostridiales bacterium]|nr:HAD-IA family hydrolase [Clostridiales bacterium]
YDKAVKALCGDLFSEFISVAIGESENVRRKPAPDSVFEALRLLNTAKDNAVYVGDSEIDVKTSKNAGIKCIGVTWGFRDRATLEVAGADIIIDSPQQLLEYVFRS